MTSPLAYVLTRDMANRRVSGLLAKRNGDFFENLFKNTAAIQDIACTRIPNGARQAGKFLIRVKSPFDWVLSYRGRSAMIDTKSLSSGNFTASKIDENQVSELYAHESQDVVSGYLVFLREKNQCLFYSAGQLIQMGLKKPVVPLLIGNCQNFDLRLLFRNEQNHTDQM